MASAKLSRSDSRADKTTLRRRVSIVADLFGIAGRMVRAKFGGASSAGTMCIVVDDRDRVLMVRASYRRHWGFAGGFLNANEDPIIGAAREVREETGVDARNIISVRSRSRSSHVDYLLIGELHPEGTTQASSAWEISAVGWFPTDRLPPLHVITSSILECEDGGLDGLIHRYRKAHPVPRKIDDDASGEDRLPNDSSTNTALRADLDDNASP